MSSKSIPSGRAEMLASMTPEQQKTLLEKLLREKAASNRSFPMSAGQQGLWHAFRREPTAANFNVFLPTRLCSTVDIAALQQTIEHVVQRHASLRTTFSDRGGELIQTVHRNLRPVFQQHNATGMSDDELRDTLSRKSVEPFDLEKGPLLRFHLYQRGPDDLTILALTHHIVTDFWSLVLILTEIREAYAAYARGVSPSLPPPVNNYQDFVRDQELYLASEAAQRDKKFWSDAISETSPVVSIPSDFLRPRTFTGRARNVKLPFANGIANRISQFAKSNRATAFAVVQSALQVFLSRYSGEKSFLVGTPFSGRGQRKYEPTIGFFVNMLPLKSDLRDDPSFANLVKRTAGVLLDALEHESYPVAQIVADANLPRDASRSPLFQVNCTFEKAHLRGEAGRAGFLFPGETQVFDFAGLKQESFYVPVKTCHYDLEFVFEQTETELRGLLCYCEDLFLDETAKRFAENFSRLFNGLLSQPDLPISLVPWAPASVPAAPLANASSPCPATGSADCPSAFSSTDSSVASSSQNSTVDQLLQSRIEKQSSQTAIRYRGQSIRYEHFGRLSQTLRRQIAPILKQWNDGPHDPSDSPVVPILAERGPLAFVAMQAVHLSGAAFVPLDVNQPSVDLLEIIAQIRAPLVLAEPDRLEQLQSSANSTSELKEIPFIEIPSAMRMVSAETESQPALSSSAPDRTAYVVFTSGSTGKPKGVVIEHGAVCNTLNWRSIDVPLDSDDRVVMLLSHQFDAGLAIAWTTLAQGATLVIADEAEVRDPDRLIELMQRERVTVLPAPPSVQSLLWSHPKIGLVAEQLKYVWTGGEQVPSQLPAQIRAQTNAKFFNFYGPTEAAIEATFCELSTHPADRMVPIGRAIPGADILILDEYHRPVPDTVPGEIAIGGRGLARGYLDNDALTREKFIPHPLTASAKSSRVYLTGDRGRRTTCGDIEFLGRTDHQVKLRGYRIELGEIDAALESCPIVERAATQIVGTGPDAKLVAHVSLTEPIEFSDSTESPALSCAQEQTGIREQAGVQKQPAMLSCPQQVAAIRRYLSKRLSPFKQPATIAVLDFLPTTASGKVDRKRLPTLGLDNDDTVEFVAPATKLEEYLAERWQNILGVERVGVQQNFFDAGGSSLQAAMLSSRLTEELGVDVPTSLLFDLADISQIAMRLVELHPSVMTGRFGEDCIVEQQERNSAFGSDLRNTHPLITTFDSSFNFTAEDSNRSPLFMIHPPGGIVVCYRELALRMGSDMPVVGIRARGLHGEESLPTTIQEMSADYVRAMKSVQLAGPYRLGGWSLGGLVAYEVAQQLVQAGERVSQLVLLDTSIPEGASDRVPLEEQVNVGREYGIDLTLDQLGALAPDEQLPFLWDHAKKLGVLDDDSPPEVVAKALEDLQNLFHHHISLAREYRMKPSTFPIHLFRPIETPVEMDVAEDRGWKHLCAGVKVQFVPGHHHSMVQPPHVQELAVRLRRLLQS